jgi:hypothetical protein
VRSAFHDGFFNEDGHFQTHGSAMASLGAIDGALAAVLFDHYLGRKVSWRGRPQCA